MRKVAQMYTIVASCQPVDIQFDRFHAAFAWKCVWGGGEASTCVS